MLSRALLAITIVSETFCALAEPARAQHPITFAWTGQNTSVDHTYNWFNNTYTVGQTVSGTFTYFDGGYTPAILSGYPASMYYGYGPQHVVHPGFSLNAGGRERPF